MRTHHTRVRRPPWGRHPVKEEPGWTRCPPSAAPSSIAPSSPAISTACVGWGSSFRSPSSWHSRRSAASSWRARRRERRALPARRGDHRRASSIFASVMFLAIEATQRQLVRQNRELTAVNAVSTAVQGELGVEVIIDAALESVIESTGATEAIVRVFPPDGDADGEGGFERRRVAAPHASPTAGGGITSSRTSSTSRSRPGPPSSGGCSCTCPRASPNRTCWRRRRSTTSATSWRRRSRSASSCWSLQRRQREGHGLYERPPPDLQPGRPGRHPVGRSSATPASCSAPTRRRCA